MVCWHRCCPLIFKKSKPKRILFKWDIVAMMILTFHDFVALFVAIAAWVMAKKQAKMQFVPFDAWFPTLIVLIQLTADIIIIFLMIELGFRLLEEGPWYGKVTIAFFHLAPSIAYIAYMQIHFFYYMGFKNVKPPPEDHHDTTVADGFFDMYGISVFHHIYVVLFETVVTVITLICCRRKVGAEVPLEKRPPFEEIAVDGVKVKLQLDSGSRVFVPGAEIAGKIIFSGAPAGSSATIDICGKATVKWKGKCRGCKRIPREETETVFSYQVITSDAFQTTLPTNVPPTFSCGKGPTGSVSYCVTATVILKKGSPATTIQLPFLVRPLQATTSAFPTKEQKFAAKETIGGFCGCIPCRNGPYGVALKLPKTEFIIGEEITFSAEIFNRSRRPILNVTASLISNVKLPDASYNETVVWGEVKFGRLRSRKQDVWKGKLVVPKTVPESASLPLSKNIQLTGYYFRFMMEIQGISENVELDVPISIGPPKEGNSAPSGVQSQAETAGSEKPKPTPLGLSQGSNTDSAASKDSKV